MNNFLNYINKKKDKKKPIKPTEHDKSFEGLKKQSTPRKWLKKIFKF